MALSSAYRQLLSDLREQLGPHGLIIVMTDPPSNNPGDGSFFSRG